jgi:hypothetical protein
MKRVDRKVRRSLGLGLAGLAMLPLARGADRLSSFRDNLGPLYKPDENSASVPHVRRQFTASAPAVRRWSDVAIDTSGIDHTPVAAGEPRVFGEQFGPGRSSRAMAIVHIAIFDAINAIAGGYKSYTNLPRVTKPTSMDAAVAQAARDALVALYPSQTASIDALLAEDLARLTRTAPSVKTAGIELGEKAAAAILAMRADDGSQHPEPVMDKDYVPSTEPGKWRQDPVSQIPLALGAHWGTVKPFVIRTGRQFRLPAPPALDSAEYAAAFEEVKNLGGDGVTTPTVRTEVQRTIGVFWAYDGTPSLCAPPRLYNQIAAQIADQRHSNAVEMARLLVLVNVSLADAGIAAWDSKYHYALWRPVTGVREADAGTGNTGRGDGNDATLGDATFTPLGAPASNLKGPNFTPPFPAYPSGHAVFGGALFQTLRKFYGTDHIAFTFVSDEFNGVTTDNASNVRVLAPRFFPTLTAAETENGSSRIYLGIHWAFDSTWGITQGRAVADYVAGNAFGPARP